MPYKDKKKQLAAQKRWYYNNHEHAKKIIGERNKKRRKDYRDWFRKLKSQYSCATCDENHPACIDFHHKDPKTKTANINAMIRNMVKKEKILEEIKKCTPLCANCHRKLHYDNDRMGP